MKNLSSYNLTKEEVEILKYGLKHPIEPKHLFKTDILAAFKQIHYSLFLVTVVQLLKNKKHCTIAYDILDIFLM